MNLNKKGLSFITIMIVVALFALVLKYTIEKVIKITIQQNDANAQATLKLISAALENYAKANNGVFPNDLSVLAKSDPQYIDKDYISKSPLKGYEYKCSRLEASGYSCSAAPVKCGLTGGVRYTVTTAGPVVSEICSSRGE